MGLEVCRQAGQLDAAGMCAACDRMQSTFTVLNDSAAGEISLDTIPAMIGRTLKDRGIQAVDKASMLVGVRRILTHCPDNMLDAMDSIGLLEAVRPSTSDQSRSCRYAAT